MKTAGPLVGAFMVSAMAYGGPFALSTLSVGFAADFGIGRALAVLPWTAFLVTTAVLSPFLGRAYDRYSDRQLLVAAVLLLATGWIVTYVAPNIAVVTLAFGGFHAAGIQLAFLGISTVVARRYAGISGLALGVAYAGAGVGIALGLAVAAAFVASTGWRVAALVFLVGALLGLPFVWLMTTGRGVVVPARAGTAATGTTDGSDGRPTFGSALATRQFWGLFLGAGAIGAFDEGVFQSFVPHAVRIGFDVDFAGLSLGIQALAWVVGQVLGGWLSDRLGRRRVGVGAIGLVIAGIAFAFKAGPDAPAVVIGGLVINGIGTGATIAVRSAAFSDIYRGPSFGVLFGLLSVAYPIGGAIAVYAAAVALDMTGSYTPLVILAVVSAAAWAMSLWTFGPRNLVGSHAARASA